MGGHIVLRCVGRHLGNNLLQLLVVPFLAVLRRLEADHAVLGPPYRAATLVGSEGRDDKDAVEGETD